jgi:putative ABC transport system permease protein
MRVLWAKTLAMLLRFPSLLATVVALSAITALTSIAGPAFLASTERGSLSNGIEQAGRWTAGLRVTYPTTTFDPIEARREARRFPDLRTEPLPTEANAVAGFNAFIDRMSAALTERMENVPFVDDLEVTIAAGQPIDALGPNGDATLRLLHRTDALDNVTKLEGEGEDGVWIASTTAENLGVAVGDEIELASERGETTARVAGIYRYLVHEDPRDYWTPLAPFIYRAPEAEQDPPALMLAGRETHERLMTDLQDWGGGVGFSFPLTGDEMSLDEARAVDDEFTKLGEELFSARGPHGKAQGDAAVNTVGGDPSDTVIPGIIRSAEERIEAVTPVVDLVSLTARMVAFAVMAAGGFFLVKKRRIEAASLAARGVGPVAQGVRYGFEALLPAVMGTALGALAGFHLASWPGPANEVEYEVLWSAAGLVGGSAAIGLALLMAAASVAVLREERSIAEIPAPLTGARGLLVASAMAVAAGIAAYSMRTSISVDDLDAIRDPRLILMPVILILAGATLGAALLRSALPSLARVVRYRSPALYLASKRLSGASGMTQVLVTASACALGIGIYGLAVSSSIREATVSKAHLFIGSDYAAQVSSSFEPPDVDFPTTHVTVFRGARLESGDTVTMMVVDPGSFARTAYWKDSFADSDLRSLLESIEGSPGGPIEVISTGDLGPNPRFASRSSNADLDVVATAEFFPGMAAEGATAVMSRESFEAAISTVGTIATRRDSIWATGEPDKIGAALLRESVLFAAPVTVETTLDSPTLQSLLWMLGLLSALGATAGAISIFGLLLYLQARHRASLIASALSRRMGLRRRTELASWGAEIGGALLTAFVVAVGVGLAVTSLMKGLLDPRPGLPPTPVLVSPAVSLIALGAALLLVAILAARRLQRSVDEADIAEVLRT